MKPPIMDSKFSEQELVTFLDYLGTKGLMNQSTANARKIAAIKVLSVLEPSEKTDLRKIDRDIIFQRFVNKHRNAFTPGSLQTYRQRFVSAIDDFISYVNDPAKFKPTGSTRAPRQSRAEDQQGRGRVSASLSGRADLRAQAVHHGLLSYPIPLPSGGVAQFSVPTDISVEDADWIASFVTTMVKALAGKRKSADH
jgi:hypothetical protein